MHIEEYVYVTPTAKTVEINALGIICQSGGINDMTVDPDAGEAFQ